MGELGVEELAPALGLARLEAERAELVHDHVEGLPAVDLEEFGFGPRHDATQGLDSEVDPVARAEDRRLVEVLELGVQELLPLLVLGHLPLLLDEGEDSELGVVETLVAQAVAPGLGHLVEVVGQGGVADERSERDGGVDRPFGILDQPGKGFVVRAGLEHGSLLWKPQGICGQNKLTLLKLGVNGFKNVLIPK